MKRIHRSSPRAIRLISLALCYALVVTTVFLPWSPPAIAGAKGSGPAAVPSSSRFVQSAGILGAPGRLWAALIIFLQGGGGLPSVPGPNLPDLDAARQTQPAEPEALPPIASSQPNPEICGNCEPGNHPPISDPGGPYFGSANQPIVFNGLGSRDVDPGDFITDYAWTFGDSPTIVHGATPSHTYQSSGNFNISLTVTDDHDASKTANTTAAVNGGPTPTPTPSASPSPSPAQANAATLVSQTVPVTMTAGGHYPVSVTMRNTGTTTWSAAHLYRLGSQSPQDNGTWGRVRVYLPTTVAPGADVTFSFTVVAPYDGVDEPPPAHFQWRMVQDGVQWFGDYTTNQTITISSNYDQPHPGGVQFGPFSDLFASRIAPEHRTGEPGEDLLSGNYNWGLGLVGLAGRSGLNLNLGLSYNSLAAWTKVIPPQSNQPPQWQQPVSWTFDADRGFPSVGFRLGFPTIQGPFYNNQTGGSSYLTLLPSGGRVELRQIGTTNVYEAVDSSYLQLLDGGNGSLLLRTTDGNQLAYWSINSEYRCTEVKDRNGNYLSIKYDPINGTANLGRMTSIIDTLGRTLSFNYDTNYRLQSITQLRNGQTHVWATFGYSALTIETNFSESSPGEDEDVEANVGPAPVVLGLPANHIVSVLTQVGLDDGSRYNFDYTSWGQVYRIKRFAADGHQLNYTSYNLPLDNSTPQSDCPRFTQRQDSAENWNNDQPLTTSFQIHPDDSWGQVTIAEGTANEVRQKEFFTTGYSDWRRGLVTRTEIYSGSSTTLQKTTTTDWTQDNVNVAYPLNPRATGVTISDSSGNRRRTTIDYGSFGLPSDVFEWGPMGTDGWTLLRRTHTDYELSTAYLNLRILGLTRQQFLFGPEDNGQRLYSKVSYEYDAGGEFLADQGDPVQHDAACGLGLVQGRGNVTAVRRWDVNYETDITHSTASTVGYNTCGSPIFSRDPLGHQTTTSYSDSFSTNGVDLTTLAFVTLAYPTIVTANDPNPMSSMVRYNYDLGLVTRKEGPPPQGFSQGAAETTEYDPAGRVKRVTNAVNNAYTRFVYPPSQTIINKFITIQEGKGEAYLATILDGAGRVRATASDFPDSTPHYSGQFTLYDQQGRAVMSTNPTEMTHAWVATGADSVGWYSSTQAYDWKGRPLMTTNTDGTTKAASYGGCGCAGGEVVTLTDEGTMDGGVAKRRQQRIYSDVLGRTVKTEILNWEGSGPGGVGRSVYSTTINTYNARDQIKLVRQFDSAQGTVPNDPNDLSCPTGSCQQTAITYDGYGRVKTKHVPEQDENAVTTYNYNADDTNSSVVDARGSSSIFTYNSRRLVTHIAYEPSAGVADTPDVSFAYDEAGNRISMTDGVGSKSYHYDQMSRMEWEERWFSGLGTYRLTYGYNLAGELTTFTDSFNATVNYNRDAAGKVSSVTGSGFANISTYASNFHYRASGRLRTLTYGNNRTLSINYDQRLRPAHYEVSGVLALDYQYYADGRLNFADDLTNSVFDRSYQYDQVGRMTTALSGAEARGEPTTNNRPYNQSFGYDAWNNMPSRAAKHWSRNISSAPLSEVNNRADGWQYDADGRATVTNSVTSTFDAAGHLIQTTSPQRRNNPPLTLTQSFDGDGNRVKKNEYGSISFLLRSTILGGALVTEIYGPGQTNVGQKYRGHVYVNGSELAEQNTFVNAAFYKHHEPGSGELGTSYIHPDGTNAGAAAQLDPLGDDVGVEDPYLETGGGDPGFSYPHFGDLSDVHSGCTVDWIPRPCVSIGIYLGNSTAAKSVTAGPDAGMLIPRLEWRFNEAPGGDDACKNGVCPEVVTIEDPGGYFAIAGFDIVSNTPAMRRMQPLLILPVSQPIGNEGLKAHVEHALSYSDCAQALDALLAKLGEMTGVAPSQTSFRALLNAITSQSAGGGLYADIPGTTNAIINQHVPPAARLSGNDIAGGGGLSWVFYTPSGRQRISTVFLLSTPLNATGLSLDRIPFAYVGRAIHELFHNAPNDSTRLFRLYEHDEMNAAAAALGARDFDQYVREHCIPRKYW